MARAKGADDMTNPTGNNDALVPAATVLLLRDAATAAGGGLELLLVRRNSKVAFGGAWAFPGGRVDQHELDQAPDDDLAAARLAAVREVEEETSLIVEPSSLTPWSHWTPPENQPRRFATWFFVCAAPTGEVTIDDGEIKDSDWMAPAHALDRHRQGDIELFPPTWVTLTQLSAFASLADVEAAASRRVADDAIERFVTRVLAKKPLTLAWADDAGYDTHSAEVAGARHRITLDGQNWRYERSGS
jgi:8-oxo-dGTP pyrophosphatase MutT (NUDIX family)